MAESSFRDRVELKIRLTGRFVICVFDDEGGPSFAYTTGNNPPFDRSGASQNF
jgi:hypothetical protein